MTTVSQRPHFLFSILPNSATISEITDATEFDFKKMMILGGNSIDKHMLKANITHTNDIIDSLPTGNAEDTRSRTANKAKAEMIDAYVYWINRCEDETRGLSAIYLSELLVIHSLNVLALLDYRFHYFVDTDESIIHLKKIHTRSIVHLVCAIKTFCKVHGQTKDIFKGVTMLQPPDNSGNKKVEMMLKRTMDVGPPLSEPNKTLYTEAISMIRVKNIYTEAINTIRVPVPVPVTIEPVAHRTRSRAVGIVSAPVQPVVPQTKHNPVSSPVCIPVAHRTRYRTRASKPCRVPRVPRVPV
jgi:hypothetical protein